ncbi:MAG: transglutaminase family protein [Halobacteriota archaeon]|nr:transglutaminase family protein [Halobacteriota archaeon]
MKKYLRPTDVIDWDERTVLRQAKILTRGCDDPISIAKTCFLFVRDEIFHSYDYKMNPVTLKASEVLRHKTGFCYSKSHLLAALLRANKIPCGLCYQRLSRDGNGPPFILHGLNTVFLPDIGWYRIDARGNNEEVTSEFDPPNERLAFEPRIEGEEDLPEIWDNPMPAVTEFLERYKNYDQAYNNLPGIFE